MSVSIEYMDGLGGFGPVLKRPVLKRPVVKKVVVVAKPVAKVLPKQASAKAVLAVSKPKAAVPVRVVTPTAPPKLTIVKPTITATTTTTAALLTAAKAAAPKGTVYVAPKTTTTVIGGKTYTSTAPATGKGSFTPYQSPTNTSLINPALVGGKGYIPPTTTSTTTSPLVLKSGAEQIYNPLAPAPAPAPVYAPPPTGNTWSGANPGTQPVSGRQPYYQDPYTPYGSGDSYGMTAEQAAEQAADTAAASDPLVASGDSGGGGGGAAEGEAAAEAAGEKPGLKVKHVVAGGAVIGILAYFLL